jgi:DNA mismatch repair protein MSH5
MLSHISLIALALVAKENNYTRPVLTQERILEIKGGRHPLQELCVDDFVPNDTFSGDQHSLMKIITGPNSSGKSVYLKQVINDVSLSKLMHSCAGSCHIIATMCLILIQNKCGR